MRTRVFVSALLALVCASSALQALTLPYTEDFDTGIANWRTNSTSTFMTPVLSGGPDGSSYALSTYNFQSYNYNPSSMTGNVVVLHRGTYNADPALSASGHNFAGNWIDGGVGEFRFTVRHNAPMPLSYYTRFAKPPFAPNANAGASAIQLGEVQPGVWTEVVFAIAPDNPEFVSFQNLSFAQIFSGIGSLQIGVDVPQNLAGVNQLITFEIDKISIGVPEPSTFAMSFLGLAGVMVRRKKRA